MGISNAPLPAKQPRLYELDQPVKWGRTSKARWDHNLGALFMVTAPVLLVHLNWIALQYFNGSLTGAIVSMVKHGFVPFARQHFPRASVYGFVGYACWISLQALLYHFLPGKLAFGQRTPGGHLLSYNTNGVMAWAVTHLLFLVAWVLGIIDPAIIAKSWAGLFVAANTYGFLMGIYAQLKGYLAPTFREDCKSTGSWIFDFWGGVELNPRIGKSFDLKFFHNGRPGIVAWTLIDLSWAAYQHQTFGHVTSSMVVVLALHSLYVLDFFFNEDWYLRTIDISHDHFGFMLAWGDSTFLPTFYTLQAQYLARYPTHLSNVTSSAILAIGIGGYTMFRLANHQRDYVRSQNGDAILWGRPAAFIRCTFSTADGKEHQSILLTSGWWGVCRHSNYTADLILTWAMCATCGFTHILPWSYFFFMSTFLVHRAGRDEQRCRNKYGEKWDEYCKAVPYRLIPGVY